MRVSVEAADRGEVVTLYWWLRRDPALAHRADVAGRGSSDESMAALDVVDVVLTHVTAIASLALSILAWRQSRLRPTPVTITRADGQTLSIVDDPAVTADLIVAFIAGSNPKPGGGGPGEAVAGRTS